ncbi:hypothetical protein FRC02_010853 [Tulasnella sp. 418]|nr:hypothetical protein FRC02_010853 [Tulasnella sp. 418]
MRYFGAFVVFISIAFHYSVLSTTIRSRSELEKRRILEGVHIHNQDTDWGRVSQSRVSFAFVKATDGYGDANPDSENESAACRKEHLYCGTYHFAIPSKSSGISQANFFIKNGGKWTSDGKTLPGVLDIEGNPHGPICYNLSPAEILDWIREFSETYFAGTRRYPTIYTNTNWWKECTDNNASFGTTSALWIEEYASNVGELPSGWSTWSFWSYDNQGSIGEEKVRWNGDAHSLALFACGSSRD